LVIFDFPDGDLAGCTRSHGWTSARGKKSRVFSTFADVHGENGFARALVRIKKIFLGISHSMCYGEPGNCVRMYRFGVAGRLPFC
jgi:hypothetical protein